MTLILQDFNSNKLKNKEINTLSDPRIIFYDIVTLTILGIEKDIYKYSNVANVAHKLTNAAQQQNNAC